MSTSTDQDRIAALVAAAQAGETPPTTDGSIANGRRRRVRTVDFSRPTKFTADQERRIERSINSFCRSASTRLSADLRVELDLEVINGSQLTWANANQQLPNGSVMAVMEVPRLGTRMLLTAELPLLISAIDLLLGGKPSPGAVQVRPLSDVDMAVARHVFEPIVSALSLVWEDVAGIDLALESVDTQPVQLAPVSEPTLCYTIEAKLQGDSSTLSILIPHRSVESVVGSFSGADERFALEAGDAAIELMTHGISEVELEVRAEVASIELPITRVLSLKPGDIVRLGASSASGVSLCADGTQVHRCRPGRIGRRRAVEITQRPQELLP